MNSNILRSLNILCLLSLARSQLTQEPPHLEGNTDVDTSSSLFIAIVAIVTLNVIVLILVVGCLWCNPARVTVDLHTPR